MRGRVIVGISLALLLTVVILVQVFLHWETPLSFVYIGIIILGMFLVMMGLRTGIRLVGTIGFVLTVFTVPFVFELQDITNALDILIFVFLVALPLVILLECISALTAGKEDTPLFQVIVQKKRKLQTYHYLPLLWCMVTCIVVLSLMILFLNLPFTSRILSGTGFRIWQTLVFTGVALLVTVPFIGPFTIKLKK